MTPTDLLCASIFDAALSAPIGVLIRTNNAARCQNRLLQFRNKIQNIDYGQITVATSPDDEQYDLWIGTDARLRRMGRPKAQELEYDTIEV